VTEDQPPACRKRTESDEQLPTQEDMIAGVLGELQRHLRSLEHVVRSAAKRATAADKGADDAGNK
jgi:hypothetical protein